MDSLFDLHTHSSRSFDNRHGPSIGEIARKASEIGLTGIAITDHDVLPPKRELRSLSEAFDILIIPGCEITTNAGHLIVIGELTETPSSNDIHTILSFLAKQDLLIIAAHPFDTKYGLGDTIRELPIHAVEINGKRTRAVNQEARRIAHELGLPLVGGSDAHNLNQLGKSVSVLKKDIETVEDVIECIKQARVAVSSLHFHTRTNTYIK